MVAVAVKMPDSNRVKLREIVLSEFYHNDAGLVPKGFSSPPARRTVRPDAEESYSRDRHLIRVTPKLEGLISISGWIARTSRGRSGL